MANPVAVPMRLTGLAFSCVLAILATALVRRTRRLPRNDGPTEQAREKRFYVNTGVEVVALLSSCATLRAIGQPVMIAPISELIVGVHFVRLAGILEVRSYRATGAALCLTVALGTLIVIVVPSWTAPLPLVAVMSLAGAVILWGTGLVGAWHVKRMIAEPDAPLSAGRLNAINRNGI